VDTSAWVDFFRGTGPVADAVDALLDLGQVALCGPVVTELRRGLRGERERRLVLPLLGACHLLIQPARLWEEAGGLGFLLARKGVTARSMDLLIATYALAHGTAILTKDQDFAAMRRAGVPIALA
jgi:predicted nucleic acid-binding protein